MSFKQHWLSTIIKFKKIGKAQSRVYNSSIVEDFVTRISMNTN